MSRMRHTAATAKLGQTNRRFNEGGEIGRQAAQWVRLVDRVSNSSYLRAPLKVRVVEQTDAFSHALKFDLKFL